jgi:hypothetical protein
VTLISPNLPQDKGMHQIHEACAERKSPPIGPEHQSSHSPLDGAQQTVKRRCYKLELTDTCVLMQMHAASQMHCAATAAGCPSPVCPVPATPYSVCCVATCCAADSFPNACAAPHSPATLRLGTCPSPVCPVPAAPYPVCVVTASLGASFLPGKCATEHCAARLFSGTCPCL